MKFFLGSIFIMAVGIVSMTIGFGLGQLTQDASKDFFVKTGQLEIGVKFRPGADQLAKDLGKTSLLFFSRTLTVCLSERENEEKIISTKVLVDSVAASNLINSIRSRGTVKEKVNPGAEARLPKNFF